MTDPEERIHPDFLWSLVAPARFLRGEGNKKGTRVGALQIVGWLLV
jgi:hypothetical protein